MARAGAPGARPRWSTAELVATQRGWEPRAEGSSRVIAGEQSGGRPSQPTPLTGPLGEFKVTNEGGEEAFRTGCKYPGVPNSGGYQIVRPWFVRDSPAKSRVRR